MKKSSSKKGQIWTLDYMIGLLIFIAALFMAIALMTGFMDEKDTYKETTRNSDHIAATLLSEQIPAINNSNVSLLKISENNRINKSKLQSFDTLTYEQKKLLFQNTGDFVFYFYNGTIINETSCFRGYNISTGNCTLEIPTSASNIAKTERLVILNSQIVKMIVISWN
jgi:hypothetical protein